MRETCAACSNTFSLLTAARTRTATMNNMAAVQKLNERELELGITPEASWHAKYKDSAWVYVGGLATELSEGDVICVMSQFGEVEDFNYPRDKKNGTPRGWCWAKFEDQRSTVLAVDNLNGAALLRRTLRVDHCEKYKLPPELRDQEEETDVYGPAVSKFAPGAAYRDKDLASSQTLERGVDVFAPAVDTSMRDGHRQLSASDAVKREAKKAKKASKKRKHEKKEKKTKKNARPNEDEAPVLNYRREALPEPAQPALAPQGRQGEVTAPSWRGQREPGAAQAWSRRDSRKKQSAPPPSRSWDEVERDRNKSYGGMGRRR